MPDCKILIVSGLRIGGQAGRLFLIQMLCGLSYFMHMKWLSCLIFWLSPAVLMAQSFAFPSFTKPVRSVEELVPPRWSIKDSVRGDLNKDGRVDLALVLEYADTIAEMRADSMETMAHPRILIVLFQDTVTGGFYPLCQNLLSFMSE